jgi:predicted Zn-dependent peptidase
LYRKSELPNGVRILSEAIPYVRSVSLGIWADVGSSGERVEQRGISHFIEHMLFKGTQRRTARQIAEEMDGVGAHLNAFTDKETTCYYAKVIDRHVPLAVDVLTDMLLHSVFDPEELAKEQKVVLEEIRMYDDNPDDMTHDLFTRTMWSGSHLGEPTIGYANTVSALTREHLREHMRLRYAPNAVVVAAAGNVDHDALVTLFRQAFACFEGTVELPVAQRPSLTPSALVKQKDTEQAYVVLGTAGLSQRDERRYTLSVLDTILGSGMSSRLFQEVREKRGLAYTVHSFQQAYRDAGLFAVSAGTAPSSVQECVDVIVEQLLLAARSGVTDAELRLAKEYMKGNLTLSLESTSGRMIRLGRGEFALGRFLPIEEIEERIEAVRKDEVLALASELLVLEKLGMCVLGPIGDITLTGQRTVALV